MSVMRSAARCLLAALLCVAAPAQTTILSWSMPPLSKASCTGPGDLNGDGIPDVVFASWVVLAFNLNVGGITRLGIPVPMAPLLAGVGVTVEAIVHDSASPFGLGLSNGFVAVAGF